VTQPSNKPSMENPQDERFSTHQNFYDYYAEQSTSPETVQRFAAIHDMMARVAQGRGLAGAKLDVLDIGCGAGTQSMMWAQDGHRVHGIDINGPLVELARTRGTGAGFDIDYRIGTAAQLPWADASMDICLVPELLEHVAEWQSCIAELTRVLKPGGLLYLSTNNALCPVQQEFNLPLYSWYPRRLKRHYERLAVTTRPELANYAKYPAVNWFTFYELRAYLAQRNFRALDRFDVADTALGGKRAMLFGAIRALPPLRWLAHVATPYTMLVAVKGERR